MAKKDKNSLLNIHYSRTMTSDNLSKAANYVGEYVLKGLGAFGKIMTAPFVQLGPTSDTIYKSKKLLAKEKAIELKSEELLGKAMTWVSPLNYGAALTTGNGLNARKGEEEVASWSPAWQAIGRLGELYAGPKAVKGVKATPRVVVNAAAKAGVKPAKVAVVAREIKLATKNKPKYTRVPSKNLFRTQVYKGGEITDPYSNFVTTDPLYASNYGKVTPYIFESKSIAKAKEPMMGSSDPVNMDMFIYYNTKGNPNATAIIGHDAVTGEFTPSKGVEILNMNPKNLYPIRTSDSPTSLKFFERKPSKISEAERAGVPKGERNNVNNSGNLERTVNDIILENGYSLPKETGMFAQKHSSIGSSYRKTFEKLWGKENTDRLTDDLLGKLILIRNHLIDTNIPLKGDFVYVVDGQAKAYRNGLEIGYLNNSYIDNGRALHPEMVKKQGTNNAGVSELLYNGTILAENRPIISGSRLLMPEVTTHIWTKYPTRKLISTEGVHAWPLRTAQERGIKLNYEKNWHTLPEFSKLHQLALDENIRTNLTGLPIYELSEPSYLPIVKNARVFDISLLRNGYINIDFTPGFAYKQGGKMNILEFLKNGSGIHIKKENRGKFTDYCGGKVTSECIAKGKASSNPAIRKRATFAANARKWKHESGGILRFLLEGGTTPKKGLFKKVGNSISNFLGTEGGQLLLLFGLNSLLGSNSPESNLAEMSLASLEMLKAQEKQNNTLKAFEMSLLILNNSKDSENPNAFGGVYALILPYKLKNMLDLNIDSNYYKLEALLKQQSNNNQNNSYLISALSDRLFSLLKTPSKSNYTNEVRLYNSTLLPKLSTNTYVSNTTLTPGLGTYYTPLSNVNKFYSL